jgi:hypothetical protein
MEQASLFLVQDGSLISKGVDADWRAHINSVFLHLLENPRLCDRSAVEIEISNQIMPGRRVHGEPSRKCWEAYATRLSEGASVERGNRSSFNSKEDDDYSV